MKLNLGFVKKLSILLMPALASFPVVNLPSQAATFASSEGILELTDFNVPPSNVLTEAFTSTLAIAGGGNVEASAEAEALINPEKSEASSFSEAFGSGTNYFGRGKSEFTVFDTFDFDEDTDFFFKFLVNLDLAIETDRSEEKAIAQGDIFFALFDETEDILLDFVNIFGNLTATGNNNFITVDQGGNITITSSFIDFDFLGQEKFAIAEVEGSVQRFVTAGTTLSLIGLSSSHVQVAVPEKSSTMALMMGFVVMLMIKKYQKSLHRV